MAGQLATRAKFMKLFLLVLSSLMMLLLCGKAEARSLIERLDHTIWGHSRELDSAFDAYDSAKYEEAAKGFQAFASRQSGQVANYNAGVASYKAGHADEASKFWQRAATGAGLDPLLKAKALHNMALVQIDKKELEGARDSLKEALSFDNDNKPIRENLEWVEQHLKQNPEENKSKDDQKQDSKQAEDKDKKDQEQKNQQKQADNKSDESKKDQKDENNQASKGQDQKPAEDKKKEQDEQGKKDQQSASGQSKEEKVKEKKQSEASAGKDQKKDGENKDKASEKKPENEKAMAEEQKGKDQDPSKEKGLESMTPEQKAAKASEETKNGQAIMTPAELKSQEAERLLRTIDDKIGRYPLTDTEATGKRGADGKNW